MKSSEIKPRLAVIGGGAAGFFCAVTAARLNPGLDVIILEKSSKLLSKVKISGGGRCNVTHACSSISDMARNYPRGRNFVKKTFHHFFTSDTISWFEERGVALKAEADGRMFPVSDSSETIITCLLNEAEKYNVSIKMNCGVQEISKQSSGSGFIIQLSERDNIIADFVCIACGGFPKAAQYDWIRQLGHQIVEPIPSLFTFNIPQRQLRELMGISVDKVRIKIQGTSFIQEGPLLITHWGLSGPAVLKLSAFAARELSAMRYEFKISLNWLGTINETELASKFQELRYENARKKIGGRNPFGLPGRLWDYLLEISTVESRWNWADLPAKQQNVLIKNLCAQELEVKGKTTFKEEFVTAGGICLSDISTSSMESKQVKDLFFAGEILDVDGITGGFNFQHAWTSGFIAGKSIALKSCT